MNAHAVPDRELGERPEGYQGPNLSPVGLEHRAHRFDDGVFALMATLPPKDNNGVIAGEDAALVVDAGITPSISERIQVHAAELTDRPVRYLVNTTYHGDHTFGNAAFPGEVVVISSRLNKENMSDLGNEKRQRAGNMYGAEAEFDAVTRWRTPDVVFDDFAEVDLGGRIVQLWQFGPGNGPGDTVVYVPDTRTAWTGNYVCHAGIAPMLLQGGPEPYLASLRRMRETLPDMAIVVPGHGPMGDALEAVDWLIGYLEQLHDEVASAVASGLTLEQTQAQVTDPWAETLTPSLTAALSDYAVPTEFAVQGLLVLCRNLHRLNVLATFRSIA
ncbi:MBL fold metallo-hydrolase [Nocardia sp. NEAU-G5]|uniref:MBL fold metallo-hydrolase n=1 Tax=Nocardia albiluteola TaxID=2842303 RepID=A0ABS6BG27_9NOCA|nr:MBL fold metallo-hydrolase [Nocardia albiluteola]MBU3068159.1 MBL fold metallo-hydrolase [Nocardia albiluteola]